MDRINKSVVISIRVNERLQKSLDFIASKYDVSVSHLINAILTSFVNEYSKSLVDNFSIDCNINENETAD